MTILISLCMHATIHAYYFVAIGVENFAGPRNINQ